MQVTAPASGGTTWTSAPTAGFSSSPATAPTTTAAPEAQLGDAPPTRGHSARAAAHSGRAPLAGQQDLADRTTSIRRPNRLPRRCRASNPRHALQRRGRQKRRRLPTFQRRPLHPCPLANRPPPGIAPCALPGDQVQAPEGLSTLPAQGANDPRAEPAQPPVVAPGGADVSQLQVLAITNPPPPLPMEADPSGQQPGRHPARSVGRELEEQFAREQAKLAGKGQGGKGASMGLQIPPPLRADPYAARPRNPGRTIPFGNPGRTPGSKSSRSAFGRRKGQSSTLRPYAAGDRSRRVQPAARLPGGELFFHPAPAQQLGPAGIPPEHRAEGRVLGWCVAPCISGTACSGVGRCLQPLLSACSGRMGPTTPSTRAAARCEALVPEHLPIGRSVLYRPPRRARLVLYRPPTGPRLWPLLRQATGLIFRRPPAARAPCL